MSSGTHTSIALITLGLSAALLTAADAQTLFNGRDVSGWRKPTADWLAAKAVTLDPSDNKKLAVEAGTGVLVNGKAGRTKNLASEMEHADCEAHFEFLVPKGSNSGIYFMGRYEIQVLDSWGRQAVSFSDCGGIYQRFDEKEKRGWEGTAPRANASKPPGEWQSFDVIFRAPRFDGAGKKLANAKFVKVVLNGQVIHENVEVTGPTRSAMFNDEKPLGPIMLQGDHGPVAYRNLRLTPLTDR